MRFSDLYVRRFRTLREAHLQAANLRVLIGRNGAGKSTLLKAIESIAVPGFFSPPGSDAAVDGNEVFAIYELDDDLSEGLAVEYTASAGRYAGQLRRAVKSYDALEMISSLLGPESLEAFVKVEEHPGEQPVALIDVDLLEIEFNRASQVFKCVDIQALRYLVQNNEEFAQLPDAFTTAPENVESALKRLIPRGSSEVATLVFEVAQKLLPLTLATPRIAWTGTQYAGVAIHRDEINEDLGECLALLAGHEHSSRQFYAGLEEWDAEYDGTWDTVQYLSKDLCRAISWGDQAPVLEIARQWSSQAPFILVSLTPGVGESEPWPRFYDGPTPVGGGSLRISDIDWDDDNMWSAGPVGPSPVTAERVKRRYSVGGMVPARGFPGSTNAWMPDTRRIDMPRDPSLGPPELGAVVARGDIRELKEEIERFLPVIHDHIWASTAQAIRSGARGSRSPLTKLLGNRLSLVYNDQQSEGREATSETSTELQDDPLKMARAAGTTGDNWLIPTHPKRSSDQPRWQIRPGIPVACRVLAYCANEIAPLFVQSAGLVEITTVQDPRDWEHSGRLKVTFDSQPLDTLPDGIARWVAISLRLAGRRLVESRIWLPAIWGSDETLKQQHLGGLGWEDPERSDGAAEEARHPGEEVARERLAETEADRLEVLGIALRAIDAMTREGGHLKPEGGLVFDIESDGHDQTLLLIDEPEANLHLDALEEVRNWLKDRLTNWPDLMAVVATHSPAIFNYTPSEARITSLERTAEGEHTVQDITEAGSTLGEWLLEFGPQLGVETLDGLFLYRGFLLVEGPTDVTVLDHFYGDELKERQILPVPLWGIKGTFDLTEARILRYTKKPAALLVDNIGYEGIEARQLAEATQAFEDQNIPFYGDGHDAVDIIFTLPETAVRRYLDDQGISGTFAGGWADIQEHIRGLRIPNKSFPAGKYLTGDQKKRKAEELLGITPTKYGLGPRFIDEVIKRCDDSDRPSETLETTMRQIFEFFDSPHEPRDTEPF